MANQDLPFGGVGNSGYGRLKGFEGFKQCSNMKSVFRKEARRYYPFNITLPPFKES
jgi:aldehyde dehydrogenase (NAD+)